MTIVTIDWRMKFLRIISLCVLLVGCSTGDEYVNVEIVDWQGQENALKEKRMSGVGYISSQELSKFTEKGVVKVNEVNWQETLGSSGSWVWSGRLKNGNDKRTYRVIDAEGANAVGSYMK